MLHPVEELFTRRLAETKNAENAADYAALEQGEYATKLRHDAVMDNVVGLDHEVLDLGCGTGLFLDKLIERGVKPQKYDGYDGITLRAGPFSERLQKHGVKGGFHYKPMSASFESVSYGFYDAVVCIGVMGYWGYHTQEQVRSLHAKMRHVGDHGAMTFPMIWHPEAMGDGHIRRWVPSDIQDVLNVSQANTVVLEREFVIFW